MHAAMHALRRHKLRLLLEETFKGDRGEFLRVTGLSKGRLTQLLDPAEPFGDTAARNLEERLSGDPVRLPPGYFDTLDARTVQFALMFESLPEPVKAQWEALAGMLGKPSAP